MCQHYVRPTSALHKTLAYCSKYSLRTYRHTKIRELSKTCSPLDILRLSASWLVYIVYSPAYSPWIEKRQTFVADNSKAVKFVCYWKWQIWKKPCQEFVLVAAYVYYLSFIKVYKDWSLPKISIICIKKKNRIAVSRYIKNLELLLFIHKTWLYWIEQKKVNFGRA